MRLLPPALATASALGLLAYQCVFTAVDPAGIRPKPAASALDVHDVIALGQSLEIAPVDLDAAPSTEPLPLERTDVIVAEPAPVRKAAILSPPLAASRPPAHASRATLTQPRTVGRTSMMPGGRVGTSSFTAALSRANFSRTDFGFQGPVRKSSSGKTVRAVKR